MFKYISLPQRGIYTGSLNRKRARSAERQARSKSDSNFVVKDVTDQIEGLSCNDACPATPTTAGTATPRFVYELKFHLRVKALEQANPFLLVLITSRLLSDVTFNVGPYKMPIENRLRTTYTYIVTEPSFVEKVFSKTTSH